MLSYIFQLSSYSKVNRFALNWAPLYGLLEDFLKLFPCMFIPRGFSKIVIFSEEVTLVSRTKNTRENRLNANLLCVKQTEQE